MAGFVQKFGNHRHEGGWGVKMAQKFLTFSTFGTPLGRIMCPALIVGTALEPLSVGLSNTHLIVRVPFSAHDISELKCNTLDQPNIEGFHPSKYADFGGFLTFPSPPELNYGSYGCAWHGVGTA